MKKRYLNFPTQKNKSKGICCPWNERLTCSFCSKCNKWLCILPKSINLIYDKKLRRLQAVVTDETQIDSLADQPSYIEGNVEGKIKLWFLPALYPGKVEGNFKTIKRKKVYSY